MPDNTDGSIVALIPRESDPITAASSEPAHITMAWLGDAADLSPEDQQALRDEVSAYFSQVSDIITASVVERGTLGEDDADVVFLDGEGLRALRDGLVALPKVAEVMARVEQYPEWTPHVTLGYPDSPANGEYAGETVEFDAASLWVGTDRADMKFELDEEAPVDENDEMDPTDEEMAAGLDEMGGEPVPWHGVIAPIGVESGDGRVFDKMLDVRDLPLPLKWQKFDEQGHDTSVVVGNITNVWEDNGLMLGEGTFASTPEAAEVIALRAEDMVRGVSVDVDRATSELATRSGKVLQHGDAVPPDTDPIIERVTSGRIASSTIVSIPAFQEAWFDLGTWDDEQAMQDAMPQDDEPPAEADVPDCDGRTPDDPEYAGPCEEEVPAEGGPEFATETETFAPGTKDGPGWITHPVPTARIRRYWVRGKGAAKIRWGAPGDFNRCRKQLVKYVQNPDWLAGLCANMHKEALGIWPGEHRGNMGGDAMTASDKMAPAYRMVEPEESLVASGDRPSKGWFANPELTGPTPLTITEDGRVFGHAATWDTCHIGSDRCVTAPHSMTEYAYFHLGEVMTDEGPLAVGNLTMGTGHADMSLKAGAATEHYDHTGTVVADVRAGEDKYGIWLAGRARPGVDLAALRAAKVSGDWRRIGASLEMVAALAVNVPGFPIPRTAVAASGFFDQALVAAAVVGTEEVSQEEAMVDVMRAAMKVIREDDERSARIASVKASIDKDNQARREALLARLGED